MTFKEWFNQMNSSKMAVARMLGIHVDTVEKLIEGYKPGKCIMKKLNYKARWLKIPITKEMFYGRATDETPLGSTSKNKS